MWRIFEGLRYFLMKRRNLIALQYRTEKEFPQESQSSFDWLYHEAVIWKKNRPVSDSFGITADDSHYLKTASGYLEFVLLLKQFPALKASFFEWVLRDGNDPIPFIEFPEAVDQLIACKLSGRISRHKKGQLLIVKQGQSKVLCLPFEGKFLNILNRRAKVTFRGNYTLSIQEIFDVFANKEKWVGNLEFMQEGIVNWNIHHLGYWDADKKDYVRIDISQNNWWEQMPAMETLNRKKVLKRYGLTIKPKEWLAAAVATRGKPNLDYDGTHAFLEVVIPKGNFYLVYDFGKLATEYPSGSLGRLFALTKTVRAAVSFPDDNVYYTHRQRGFYPFLLSKAQGNDLMKSIKADIEVSRGGNFIYQIESENCAKWVHLKLAGILGEKAVPDFFRMQLLDTHPEGVVSFIFAFIKKLPSHWQVPVLTFLHLPLGAFRKIWIEEEGKKVAKSLSCHSFFKTGQIFLPALLIEKVLLLLARINLYKNYSIKKSKFVKLGLIEIKGILWCRGLFRGFFKEINNFCLRS